MVQDYSIHGDSSTSIFDRDRFYGFINTETISCTYESFRIICVMVGMKIIYSGFFLFSHFPNIECNVPVFFLFVFKIDSSNDEDKEKFPR